MSKKSTTPSSAPAANAAKPAKATGRVAYVHKDKIAAMPTDYDFAKHLPLKRDDFADDVAFMQFKAAQAQFNVARFNEKIGEAKALGGVASAKARRAVKRAKRLTARLLDQLAAVVAEGITEQAFMLNVLGKDEAFTKIVKTYTDAVAAEAKAAAKK